MGNEYYLRIDAKLKINGGYVIIIANKEGLENLKNKVNNLLINSSKNFLKENVLMLEELGGSGLTRDNDIIYEDQILVKILRIRKLAVYDIHEYYLRVDVKIEANGANVIINANKKGLENLKDAVDDLLDRSIDTLPDDVMLMIEEFGGEDLTKDTPEKGYVLVNILKIYRWD